MLGAETVTQRTPSQEESSIVAAEILRWSRETDRIDRPHIHRLLRKSIELDRFSARTGRPLVICPTTPSEKLLASLIDPRTTTLGQSHSSRRCFRSIWVPGNPKLPCSRLSGHRSRRGEPEHRLVYQVENPLICFPSGRHHCCHCG